MATTLIEPEYGTPLNTIKTKSAKSRTCKVAIIVGLIVMAMAAVEMYFGIPWLYKKWIRVSSWAAFGALLAQPPERDQLLRQLAIGEGTIWAWWYVQYALATLTGLTGLWVVARLRFGWRMLWGGAIVAILAGVATVAAGWALERHAGFPIQSKRIHAIVFLVYSAPGWVILSMWLAKQLFGPRPVAKTQAENTSDLPLLADEEAGQEP